MKEIKRASGGPWGGIYVDRKYYQLLGEIFGNDFMNKLKQKFPSTWFSMMIDFEMKKRSSKPDNAIGINLALSLEFSKQFEKQTGEEVEERIKKKKHLGIKYSNGMLRITGETMRGMYSEVLPPIKEQLHSLLYASNGHHTSTMFVVGGFGESAYLQDMLITEFGKDVNILITEEAGICVMKGSVLFGHDLRAITSRIARYNYGYPCFRPFNSKTDDPALVEIIKGRKMYLAFKSIVRRGQTIKIDDVFQVEERANPTLGNRQEIQLVYSDYEGKDGDHIRHPSVQLLERLFIDSPKR